MPLIRSFLSHYTVVWGILNLLCVISVCLFLCTVTDFSAAKNRVVKFCMRVGLFGRKLEDCAPFGGAGSPSNTMWPGPRPTSVPSGILVHPAVWLQYMGQKVGAAVPPPLFGMMGPHLTQCRLGQGQPPYQLIQPAVWPQQTWAENCGAVPLFVGEAGTHLTQCRLGRRLPSYQVAP